MASRDVVRVQCLGSFRRQGTLNPDRLRTVADGRCVARCVNPQLSLTAV